MRWTIRVAAIGLALLAIASPGLADDQQPPGWQFEFMPYGWIPGTFGTIQVKGRTASVDADIGDVLTLLVHGDAFALGGYFAARYDRWSAFADAWGGFVNINVSETIPTRFSTLHVAATARLRPVIADFAVGYQLGEWSLPDRKRPVSLGGYLGNRYTYLGTELDASGAVQGLQGAGRSVSENFDTLVPLIGVRSEVPLLDTLSLDVRGDVGGLPASSRLTWQLVGDLRYWLTWAPFGAQTWLEAGYRVVAFDQGFGGGNDVNLQLRGPLLAMGFVF